MYWLLSREVLRMRGQVSRAEPWSIMVDLFMYREPEETEQKKELDEPAAESAPVAEQQQPLDWASEQDVAQPTQTAPTTGFPAPVTQTVTTTQTTAQQGGQAGWQLRPAGWDAAAGQSR